MIALKEPKKKRRVRLRPRKPFPINIGSEEEWTTYTGYLGNLGVCIIEPYEIEALHSSGFFGKGSLSRSFPNFEKTRSEPPTVRHRQWARRQEWFEQADELDARSFLQGEKVASRNPKIVNEHAEKNSDEEGNYKCGKEALGINSSKSENIHETSMPISAKVNEVLLDSSEEDEICEISNTGTTETGTKNASDSADIILLNDEEMLVDVSEENFLETENDDRNSENFAEVEERKLLVLPDSDSDVDNYFSNVKPIIEKEGFPVRESIYLTFEEAFFLMFGLGCLQIIDFDGNLLNILEVWKHFCKTRKDFLQKYVVYHYFRSKGWVVKPGLKYGGDFLLYKQGPPFYHASYIVIVEISNADTLIRDEKKIERKMTWKKLFGLDRLSETAAKEILFAQVLWPSKIPLNEIPSSPEVLAEFTVRELLYRRWIPRQTREEIDLVNDDGDNK